MSENKIYEDEFYKEKILEGCLLRWMPRSKSLYEGITNFSSSGSDFLGTSRTLDDEEG